jgi:UDP-N-acetyl-D-glucosamine dehydrogenase
MGAKVSAADSYVDSTRVPDGVEHVELDTDVLRSADAVIFLVDHDDFDPALVTEHAGYVLDARHVVPPGENVEYL